MFEYLPVIHYVLYFITTIAVSGQECTDTVGSLSHDSASLLLKVKHLYWLEIQLIVMELWLPGSSVIE